MNNNGKRNVLSILVCMLVSVFCLLPAGARPALAGEDRGLTLAAETISVKAGEDVKVNVILNNNPGLSSLKFTILYDDMLALEDVALSKFCNDICRIQKIHLLKLLLTFINIIIVSPWYT